MSSPAQTAWKSTEDKASATRCKLSADAASRLIGGDKEHMPRIGMCLSGGGWRAMTSACALFDALSVPVEGPKTKAKVKPLDCVSHAFGLSGGSWMLFNTAVGGEYNAFHRTANPWLYGSEHEFNEAIHDYDGLAHMVSKEVVDEACHRGGFRKQVGFLSTKVGADATIAAALGTERLGPSLVERWANFIANDILGWVDENEMQSERSAPGGAKRNAPRDLSKYKNTRGVEAKSRHLPFSQVKKPIEEGKLPFIVCTAIADKPKPAGEEPLEPVAEDGDASPRGSMRESMTVSQSVTETNENSTERNYDWVEFSPFFARNPETDVYFESPDQLYGRFWKGDEAHPLSIHHMMSVCGSAFACDLTCAMPPGLTKAVKRHHLANVTNEPLIGRGITTIESEDGSKSLGNCRDAGIDFNVPLPPMLSGAGREFDIILVMDAGAGSKNAFELHRAVELGYLELMPDGPKPLDNFGPGKFVQVFRSKDGGPIIIYMLGLCERGTHQIINHRADLLSDVDKLRERVRKTVVPALVAMMSMFRRDKERLSTFGQTAGSIINSVAGAAMSAAGQDDDEVLLNRALTETMEEVVMEETPEDALAENVASNVLGPQIGDEVRAIMLQGSNEGKVRNIFDAFHYAAGQVLNRVLKDEKTRQLATIRFDVQAQMTFYPSQSSVSAAKNDYSFMSTRALTELIRLDILQYTDSNDIVLSPAWNDYFAATGLAASMVGDDPAKEAISRKGSPPTATPNALQNMPIDRATKIFTMLSGAVLALSRVMAEPKKLIDKYLVELNANISKYLHTPGQKHVEKQHALDNYVEALTAAGLDEDLMKFVDTIDQRSQVMVACSAARCGNSGILQKLPPMIVNKKNVVGSAYASTASDEIIAWLKAEFGLSLSLAEAAELGYPEAANELLRLPENQDNLEAATLAIEYNQQEVFAIFWAAASTKFKDVLLQECNDHAVSWNPMECTFLSMSGPEDPSTAAPKDAKTRALDTFNVLKDKAMTPAGMETKKNVRVRKNGIPIKEAQQQERQQAQEAAGPSNSDKAAAAAKAAASKVFGFGSKLLSKHKDPSTK